MKDMIKADVSTSTFNNNKKYKHEYIYVCEISVKETKYNQKKFNLPFSVETHI